MICFEKIRYKNFLSTGNQFTEIDFTKTATTLVIGNNGAGKSTMLDALTFSLFGKSYRGVNKPLLINSVNEKDCLVEIEFKIGNTAWKVVRGIKPAVFQIYKDGALLNSDAAAKDQQTWLERVVLKMNYKSFTQIVILGSSNFIPFMQLPAASRREVIEDLLDIKIFSSMNTVVKENIKASKDEIRTLDYKTDNLEEKVKMQKDFIAEVERLATEDIGAKKTQIKTLTDTQDNLLKDSLVVENSLIDKQKELEKYSGATAKLRKLGNLKGKISQKVSVITEEHKFFSDNTVCPTCQQGIEEDFRLDRISEAQSKLTELEEGFKKLEQSIKEEENRELLFTNLSKEVTSLTHGISQNNTRVSGLQRQSLDLQSEIQTITDKIQNRNSEHEKLEQLREGLQTIFGQLAVKKEEVNYQSFAYDLLKDGGVKTKIIKKYLPLINQQVNRYLQLMDFYINFKLDEEFVETIQSPIHDKFSYSSFSEGEKMRIDLALLFTWREVARFKNSANTNLLIMDEVFDSSLDSFGTDDFLKIIRYVIKDANIFVISHKSELLDKFDNVLKFEKVKGFSKLSS